MSGHGHQQPGQPDSGARSPREGVDPEVLEFAQMLFQLARDGETELPSVVYLVGVTPDLDERARGRPAHVGRLQRSSRDRACAARAWRRGGPGQRPGQTALAGAVFKGYGEVVRILFEAGADPNGGVPTAIDTARMFEKDAFLELFGV